MENCITIAFEIRYLEKKEMEKEDRKRDFKNDWRATLFWKK